MESSLPNAVPAVAVVAPTLITSILGLVYNFKEIIAIFLLGLYIGPKLKDIKEIPSIITTLNSVRDNVNIIILWFNRNHPDFIISPLVAESPRKLNSLGLRIIKKLQSVNPDFESIVQLLHRKILGTIKEKEKNPYDLEVLSINFAAQYDSYSDTVVKNFKDIAFSEGSHIFIVHEVLGIVLRDRLMGEFKIIPNKEINDIE